MAEALEEHASPEVIKCDKTIETLEKERDGLIEDKRRLVDEKDFDRALSWVKAAEDLTLEKAKKATDVTESLWKEVDTEKASSAALLTKVEQRKKRRHWVWLPSRSIPPCSVVFFGGGGWGGGNPPSS